MATTGRKRDREKERLGAPLRAWCKAYGPGALTHLHKETGLTFAAISRIRDGVSAAKPSTARLIEAATRGSVRAAALLGLEAA